MTVQPAAVIRFEVPGVPPSLSNQRLHWSRLNRLKAEWKEAVYFRAQAARILGHWTCAHRRFDGRRQVEVVLHRARLLDPDNAYASVKPVLDALVGVLIVDDAPDWCELHVRQVKVAHRGEQKTEVTVRREPTPQEVQP